MSKQATIRDVAEKTGYSFQTVSRVLNGRAHLHKEATVAKIEKAAEELGYVQNLFAKAMQSGKTWSVGMIIDPFIDSFTKDIFRGAHDKLLEHGYLPILLLHSKDSHDEDLVKRLAVRRVEGLIIRPYPDMEGIQRIAAEVQRQKIPVVSVDYTLQGSRLVDFVGTADERGGQMAAEHLLQLGHRKVAGVFAPVESLSLRRQGFEKVIAEEGIAPPDILNEWDFADDESNLPALKALLQRDETPSALFVGGDFMLPAVYRVAHELKLSIPRDLSVIGFGDMTVSRQLAPPVTTLRQDACDLGIQAAKMVIERIENTERTIPFRQLRFEPQLIERESTTAAPGR
jgi:DNA-binding LacI/PurR family transcriptional regulator